MIQLNTKKKFDFEDASRRWLLWSETLRRVQWAEHKCVNVKKIRFAYDPWDSAKNTVRVLRITGEIRIRPIKESLKHDPV